MSIKVFERLKKMLIETTHEERAEIDREIEARTGKYCDKGVEELSDTEFIEVVNKAKRKRKKKRTEKGKEEKNKYEQNEQDKYKQEEQEAGEKIEVACV